MAANIDSFIKKYNGKTLRDDGCYLSSEFKGFQTAFINAMKKIAASLGGEVVNTSKGHYDVSGFIKRGDKYVYFDYSNGCGFGGRTHIILKGNNGCYHQPLLIRAARHEKDYTGFTNNFASFDRCETLIERLLN